MKYVATALLSALPILMSSANCPAAARSDDVNAQIVRFSDLDLSRPAGAQALYHRIQGAARDVCEVNAPRAYLDRVPYQQCVSAAIARAVVDIDAPLLTEYHQSATHRQILRPGLAQLNR
jgi:UrcA family protein